MTIGDALAPFELGMHAPETAAGKDGFFFMILRV
jgi:hypothetical protein